MYHNEKEGKILGVWLNIVDLFPITFAHDEITKGFATPFTIALVLEISCKVKY